MRSSGPLLCLASAAAFGAMGIFGKLAYEQGASVGTLLATRFVLAAALFWGILACTGGLRGLRALSRRDVGIGLALGAIGYCVQTGAYFAALERVDASLLGLLVYTFPVIVTVAAIALGREQRPHARPLPVGELAEDPHRAEGRGGGEAEQGAGRGHGSIFLDRTGSSNWSL